MHKFLASSLIVILLSTPLSLLNIQAYSDHPDLFVSAENSFFENHFSGAMVVEVIVKDSNINPIDQQQGEPQVTLNGKQLRMVQGSSGNWYAFFANVDKAKQADQISLGGVAGENLDFGAFCDRSTDAAVLGVSFSQTDGIAIPNSVGITGATQGTSSFNACTGSPTSVLTQMSVIRNTPSLNMNPKVNPGQIGINPNAWPFIQLFTFSNNVSIEYDKAGGSESVDLTYDDMTDISMKLDRTGYPQSSDVFATINDMQLNEDPTAINSWTFNINSPAATFYQAFPESGSAPSGLVNLFPNLNILGFRDNGHVEMNLGSAVELRTNQLQTASSLTSSGINYNNLVTFVETSPNSGIFQSDYVSKSTIGILSNAPRFQSGTISYNLISTSILSGTDTGSISVGAPNGQPIAGTKQTITLQDNDQNFNSAIIEHLDDFRSSAIIPALKFGNPFTLNSASDVQFYSSSSGFASPIPAPSTIPDKNSARLIVDSMNSPNGPFKKITLNLGITAQALQNLFIDTSKPNSQGTDWINYDLRSFQLQLGVNSFSDTSMTLYFGSLGNNHVQILSPGSISTGNGIVQISNADITSITGVQPSSEIFVDINLAAPGNPVNGGTICRETDPQEIVFDLFLFGNNDNQKINNQIYSWDCAQSASNYGVFVGTMEYVITNQLNQFDPSLIKSLHTFGQSIKFLVNDQLVDNKGINFSVSGVTISGGNTIVTSKSDIQTHKGVVSLDSQSYRLGQPVFLTLTDSDLSTDQDTIQTYTTVNNPGSLADDTVGGSSGNILLEVWIKGFRFHHCTINGITYGGLAATGFTLTETGPGTGIFKGSFNMPSQICNEDGTKLISPIGGSIQAWYHDFKDDLGRSVVVGLTQISSSTQTSSSGQTPSSTQGPSSPQGSPLTGIPLSKINVNSKITDTSNRPFLQNPKVGKDLIFATDISNEDNTAQIYTYILQIKDADDKVVYLKIKDGSVASHGEDAAKLSWTPTSSGKFTAEIFLWNQLDDGVPLIPKTKFSMEIDKSL